MYYMSSISSCTTDLCALANLGHASFKSTYHVGVSRMEAIESTNSPDKEGGNIEDEEFTYYHKPTNLKRRTFISTSYTTSRPLSQCFSGSNKRRRFCDLDNSGEAATPSGSSSSAQRPDCDAPLKYREALYYEGSGEEEGGFVGSERPSLSSLSRSIGSDMCRSLAGATSFIESFANPSLEPEENDSGESDEDGGREQTMEGADYFFDSPGEKEVLASSRAWKIPGASQLVCGGDVGVTEDDEGGNKSGSFLGGLEWF
jgi:hypothetical protein